MSRIYFGGRFYFGHDPEHRAVRAWVGRWIAEVRLGSWYAGTCW